MSGIRDRLESILNINNEDLPILCANAADKEGDIDGSLSTMVVGALRFNGVANYILHQDIGGFKTNLTESAGIWMSLYERFEKSEPISESYMSMLSYKSLFDALASGSIETAKSLASLMGGRDEIEKYHDHPFDYALGYALRSFVLNDTNNMEHHWNKFDKICREKENRDFQGYAHIFLAIIDHDLEAANQGFTELIKGHKKQSKGRGVFKDSEDEVLCVWGLGMANLCRSYNLKVDAIPPLIPADLLID